jgi:peroxiredoxin
MKRLFLMLFVMAAFFASCGGEAENNTDDQKETADTTETTSENEPEEEEVETVKGYAVGDIAEDFSLKNVDGKMVSMADYEDAKGFVVIFTCNHCPYSIAYEDRIIEFDKAYKEKGYPVIAINPNDPSMEAAKDDSYELMQERAKEKGFTFPYLFDETQEVFPKYGATKTPHCYVLQKSEAGLKVAYIGAFDDSKEADEVGEKHIENAVNALLEGNSPDPAEVAAFGCGIKCKDKSKLAKS